jgi:hypothetical protein
MEKLRRLGGSKREAAGPTSRFPTADQRQRFKVWITRQVRRVTKPIRREMRRRTAIESVIGHLKDDHRMGRNHLKGRDGDRINAVTAAAITTSAYSGAASSGFCVPCGRSSVEPSWHPRFA